MRLDVDIAFDAPPARVPGEGSDVHEVDLHTLAGAARSPRALGQLLRERAYDEVHVHEGALPPSSVQAACLVALCAVRTRRFVVDGRSLGRASFLARALARAAVAIPSELVRSAILAGRLRQASRRQTELPRHAVAPRRVMYLRVDPTLRWHGAQVGGAATHTSGVVNGLLDNGLEVTVLAAEQPVGTGRARFVAVPPRRILHLIHALAYSEYSEALVQSGSGLPADFVYQRYQLGSDAGLVAARRLGVPLVLEFNGSEIWVARNWNPGRLRLERTLTRLERRNLLDASLVVVVSKALRDVVVATGVAPECVLVDPNGVDLAALAPYRELTPAEWRTRLDLADEPTVGFIGTFGLWHGVKLLPALVEAVPEARWVIVGDGDLFAEVRDELTARGVAGRVVMPGILERPRALELLAACDVCVSPHVRNTDGTPFFGSPTKLFEYMGLRRPIVAADLDQIGEVLEHGRTALLHEPGDVAQASAAISRLLSDEALRENLAEAALSLAEAKYTWKSHASRIVAALAAADNRSPKEIGTLSR